MGADVADRRRFRPDVERGGALRAGSDGTMAKRRLHRLCLLLDADEKPLVLYGRGCADV